MAYQVGIDARMGALIGRPACDPHLSCDGCGIVRPVAGPRGPFAWFLDGKRAPGWTMAPRDGKPRRDWCGACSATLVEVTT